MDHSWTAVTFDFKIGKDGFGLGEVPGSDCPGVEWSTSGNESDMGTAVQVDAPSSISWRGVWE